MTKLIYAVDSKEKTDILQGLGKTNFLVSYYSLRNKRNLLGFLNSIHANVFMLDSGAYSAWSHSATILLYDYLDFIKKYHSYFTHIVCLDVINNPILSEVNHLIMQRELKEYNLEIIPVFHSGEPFSVLDYLVNREYKYLGISPNNNWREIEKRNWLKRVFDRYDFEKLGIKTHGFGYQSVVGLRYFPLTTCDAATWEIMSGYGRVIHPSLNIRYSNESTYSPEHIDNISEGDPEFVIDICKDIGITPDDLRIKRSSRVLFNAEALDRLVALDKKTYDSENIELFDGSNSADFTEEKVLIQLETCLRMGHDYTGNLSTGVAQKKSRKQKSKESLF